MIVAFVFTLTDVTEMESNEEDDEKTANICPFPRHHSVIRVDVTVYSFSFYRVVSHLMVSYLFLFILFLVHVKC